MKKDQLLTLLKMKKNKLNQNKILQVYKYQNSFKKSKL